MESSRFRGISLPSFRKKDEITPKGLHVRILIIEEINSKYFRNYTKWGKAPFGYITRIDSKKVD